ncbi:hypothetical protein [Planococcus sp. YIM B11945]
MDAFRWREMRKGRARFVVIQGTYVVTRASYVVIRPGYVVI